MSDTVRDVRQLAQAAMERAADAEHAIESHERVCSERYATINDTLRELRSIMKGTALLLITALGVVAWAYLQKSLGL